MEPEQQITMEPDIICDCGRKYLTFYNYKNHILKHKCHQKTAQNPLTAPENTVETIDSTSQNTNTNQSIIANTETEITHHDIAQLPSGIVAYKSSHANLHPKENCKYCNKLYSKHNIKTHQIKCKDKYKESYEYKLLVRAGIPDIPETYIGIRELFVKLNTENPQIFTNLPKDESALEEFERGLPQRGRPRKESQSSHLLTNANNNNQKVFKRHTTINNITNNNNNITNNVSNVQNVNNNITQQNINVFINPVCQESIAHITPERQMYIILQRLNAYKALIDSIYEAPANHNIYISDRKGEQVKYLDKEHGVNNGEAKDIIGDIAMAHLGHLDDFIETHKKDIPEHRKNDLNFLEEFLINENNNPDVIKQLNDKVVSLTNSSKTLLDKYEKNKVAEFINRLPQTSNQVENIEYHAPEMPVPGVIF